MGSTPVGRAIYTSCRHVETIIELLDLLYCGCSLVVKPQPSKLMMRVRFPSPAPKFIAL